MNPALKENKDFLHVLIIGNGFDLAHGLETKYTDFLDSCNNYNSSWFYYFKSKILLDEITKPNAISNERFWFDLEQEIYKITRQPFLCTSLAREIEKLAHYDPFTKTRIIDAIPENPNVVNFLHRNKIITPEELVSIFQAFSSCTLQQLSKDKTSQHVIELLDSELRCLVKKIAEYLSKEIENLTQNPKFYFCLKELEGENRNPQKHTLWVLNFNYTPTFQKLYEPTLTERGINVHHYHIHGALGEGNLVLGCQSFDPADKIDPAWNVFTKHHQRHRYGTIEKYQELLKELRHFKGEVAFHIIGHSLDQADHAILKHALCSSHNTTVQDSFISVYYHDEEAHLRLINTITSILEEEAVMARVRFIDQHDPKRGILRHIHETSKNQ